MMQQKPS